MEGDSDAMPMALFALVLVLPCSVICSCMSSAVLLMGSMTNGGYGYYNGANTNKRPTAK